MSVAVLAPAAPALGALLIGSLPEFAAAHAVLTAAAAVAAAANLVLAVHPRLAWTLTKWQYRDPDAVEPSRIAFNLRRIRYTLLFCVFGAALVLLLSFRPG
ncbi:hypothetical protein [Nocardiopsis coralliicola]